MTKLTLEELTRRKTVLENEVLAERNGKKAHKEQNISVWQDRLDEINILISKKKSEPAATNDAE